MKKNYIHEEEDTRTDDEETESKENYEGFAFLQDDVLCSIQKEAAITKRWILLDSQSTVDVFSMRCCLQILVMQNKIWSCRTNTSNWHCEHMFKCMNSMTILIVQKLSAIILCPTCNIRSTLFLKSKFRQTHHM